MKFKGLDWLQDELDSYAGYETPYGDTSVKYVVKVVKNGCIDVCQIYRYSFPLRDHYDKPLEQLYSSKILAVSINNYGNTKFNPDLSIFTGLIPILSHFINMNKLDIDYKDFKHRAVKTAFLEASLNLESRIRLDKNKLWEMY